MSADSRGIRRGQCNECGSKCGGYSKDSGGVKCICGHPPGKHVNLDLPASTASTTGGKLWGNNHHRGPTNIILST